MSVSPEEKDKWHQIGQEYGSTGQMRSLGSPWRGPFESFEDYQERLDAYNAGYENGMENPSPDE